MYRLKLLSFAALGLTLLSLPFRVAPSFAADQAHSLQVRLSWLTSGYQAAFYLAAAKGWYAKAGLDVSLTQEPDPSPPFSLSAAGNTTPARRRSLAWSSPG
jgi:ABC-type nitrate/sulfonate/bicarbonate transport system substrate-binding protein